VDYKLKILSLKCYLPDESAGDDIYLELAGKKIWPTNAKFLIIKTEDNPVNLEFNIQKGDKITIDLWDHDLLTANDHLGSLTINAEAHGHFENEFTKLGKDQSKYALEWEIG
jgi:hypothetical protein